LASEASGNIPGCCLFALKRIKQGGAELIQAQQKLGLWILLR